MLLFLRHFGCIFCREALADLGRVRNDLEARGVRVAIAHMHSEAEAAEFLPRYKLEDAPRVSDPTRDLFRAFGLRDGSALENSARDYLANLHVQAAVYHSHQTGRRVTMAQFDPDNHHKA